MKNLKKLLKKKQFSIGFLIFCGFFFMALWASPPLPGDLSLRLLSPNRDHPLGCDVYGQDLMASILYGCRVALSVAFTSVFITILLGTFLGMLAGLKGGWLDMLIMRGCDLVLAFPSMLLAMALASFLGPSTKNIIISIGLTGWTSFAVLCRHHLLVLKEMTFVDVARIYKASGWYILKNHFLPHILPVILVQGSFNLSGAIITEASLSFLGLGDENPSLSWGGLLNQGRLYLMEAPALVLGPGAAIFFLVLSLNLMSESIRTMLDPKAAQE